MGSLLGLYAVPAQDEDLVAPVLSITVAQDEYPPAGTIEFDFLEPVITTRDTDTWRVQVATDLAFTSPTINASGTVGEGAVVAGMSGISSGKHFFRSRIERAGLPGPWGTTIVHGDGTAPTITSDDSISVMEGDPFSHTFTSDKPGEVVWSLFGGADAAKFSVNASAGALTFTITPDFEEPADADADNEYVVNVRATDLANNFTLQTLTVTLTDDVTDNPLYTEWTKTNGSSKSAYALVTGTPKLSVVGTTGVGAAMLVRAKRAANTTQFQFETVVTATHSTDGLLIGVDDGTTSLAGYTIPGQSDVKGVAYVFASGEQYVYHSGAQNYENGAPFCQVGDVFSVVYDEGDVSCYRTRSGSTVQIGSTITVSSPWTNVYPIGGSNGEVAQTTNFGASAPASGHSSGFGAP